MTNTKYTLEDMLMIVVSNKLNAICSRKQLARALNCEGRAVFNLDIDNMDGQSSYTIGRCKFARSYNGENYFAGATVKFYPNNSGNNDIYVAVNGDISCITADEYMDKWYEMVSKNMAQEVRDGQPCLIFCHGRDENGCPCRFGLTGTIRKKPHEEGVIILDTVA